MKVKMGHAGVTKRRMERNGNKEVNKEVEVKPGRKFGSFPGGEDDQLQVRRALQNQQRAVTLGELCAGPD